MTADIAALATQLVQQAPELDGETIEALRRALERVATPLARSIARIVELVAIDVVDPAIALPALAEACATLEAGLAGRVDDRVLEAARYQIDTLQPVPGSGLGRPDPASSVPASGLPPGVVGYDVPASSLGRRRRT